MREKSGTNGIGAPSGRDGVQYLVFLVLAPLTSLAIIACLVMVSRRPRTLQVSLVTGILVMSLGYLVTNALELVWPTEAGTMLFAKLSYPFSTSIPVLFSAFVLVFTGREDWLRGRRWIILLAVPAAASALAAAEPLHRLIWTSVTYTPVGGMLAMSVTYGWFFWVLEAYTIALLAASAFLLLRAFVRGQRVYRVQAAILVAATVIPLLVFLLYALKAFPGLAKNYQPVTYGACCLLIMASMRQHRFLDLLPVARSTLMDEMTEALLVVDAEGRIVDANGAARSALGAAEDLIGAGIGRFPALAGLTDLGPSRTVRREIHMEQWGTRRWFDARVSRLASRTDDRIGYMIILRDVTETHELLEEKNRLIEELTGAAVEIKTLQGIIPICMYCKKIRDDAGYWHQVENYVGRRSKAQFSHGLCPECMKKQEERCMAAQRPGPSSGQPGSPGR
jgi:PAS domain S-box-containing protein